MPSLRFVPYREIAREIAARLAAGREGRDALAPWDEEVIVPSRGMAEAIGADLLARMPRGIAGLQLRTLEELAARRSGMARVATEAERRVAMRMASRLIDDPVLNSRGVASMLERSYRDVRDSGVTLAEFSKRNRRGVRNAKRIELAVRAWTEYERILDRIGSIDPADRLLRASRAEFDKPQLLAGFYDMTGAQLQLAQAMLRADRIAGIWIPSQQPFARAFVEALGEPFVANTAQAAPPLTLTVHDTRLDEMRDVCARVAALLASGVPAHEIGIVARSLEPYDARLLNRFAAEHGFATTLAEEQPLSAHRIGRGALTLLRLRDHGFPRAEVLSVLRDGLHARTSIDVDEADAATRRARIAGGTSEELRRMRNRSPIIDAYVAFVAELEELTATIDAGLLARLGSLFRIDTDADLAAAEKLDDVASLFRRLGTTPLPDVIDALEHQTLSRRQPSDGERVWAGEVLRFRGRSFTHLFAVRMQDDVFPQRRTEDPLLPDSDRRILGLREIGDGADEERLLFSLLTDATSGELHFSFASGDGFGKVLRPSRFVRGVPRTIAPPTPAHRAPMPANRQLQLLVKTGTRSAFDGYLPPFDPERFRAFSPTQLEDFGECPQKFLLKHILRVEDLDHPERELQIHHRDKGILDHRILEKLYRDLDAEDFREAAASLPRLPEPIAQRLDALVDEHFDEHEAIAPPFNRTVRDIERRATKRILREFVINDIGDLAANELTPKWFEYRFGAKHRERGMVPDHQEPFLIDAGGVPVRVEGTIDRIDEGEASLRIVDYKSGKALRHANLGDKIDRGVRLQLALYAMAVSEFFQADPASVSGTIKPLVQGEIKPVKFAFALDQKRDSLLETLEIFIRAILAGHFPAFPNERDEDFNSCKYCPVNHSCRTKHDLDERYAVQQQRDPRTLLGGSR